MSAPKLVRCQKCGRPVGYRLHYRACKGSNVLVTTGSGREAGRYLQGVFSEERVVKGITPTRKTCRIVLRIRT